MSPVCLLKIFLQDGLVQTATRLVSLVETDSLSRHGRIQQYSELRKTAEHTEFLVSQATTTVKRSVAGRNTF